MNDSQNCNITSSPLKSPWFWVIAVLLCVALLWQTSLARDQWSVTYDETFYLNAAQQTVHDGWIDKRIAQAGVGSLPITLTNLPVALTTKGEVREDIWQGSAAHLSLNHSARILNVVLIGIPLILLVYTWMVYRRGQLAGTLAAGLLVFSPSLLAHTTLATTDACFVLFALLAIAAMIWRLQQPSWPRFLLLVIATGLAISAKYSGVFLFPLFGLMQLKELWPLCEGATFKRVLKTFTIATCRVVLLGSLSTFVIWGTDWFSFAGPLKTVSLEETPDDSPWIKLFGKSDQAQWMMDMAHRKLYRPSVAAALIARSIHQKKGHPAYLLGMKSERGWRYYFICAWLFKSTPPELLLSLMVIPLWIYSRTYPTEEDAADRQTQVVWATVLIIFWVLVCTATVNIGQRYLLLMYPLTGMLAIDLLWSIMPNKKTVLGLFAALFLLGQIVSAVSIAPHYLSYFSPLIGGPDAGRFLLLDSNLDWGQDLPALKETLAKTPEKKVVLKYFGSSEPKTYGIEAIDFSNMSAEALTEHDLFAISATHLHGVYLANDPFAQLREHKPLAYAGYSILIYDLNNAQVLQAVRRAIEIDDSDKST